MKNQQKNRSVIDYLRDYFSKKLEWRFIANTSKILIISDNNPLFMIQISFKILITNTTNIRKRNKEDTDLFSSHCQIEIKEKHSQRILFVSSFSSLEICLQKGYDFLMDYKKSLSQLID